MEMFFGGHVVGDIVVHNKEYEAVEEGQVIFLLQKNWDSSHVFKY